MAALVWHEIGSPGDIEEEDVLRFDLGARSFAIYNTEGGFFATDGWCTHERAHLAEGLVLGDIIECPMHQGRFRISTGETKGGPVCEALRTYPVKLEGGRLFIGLAPG